MTKIDISSLNIDEYYNSIDTNKIKNELQTYKPKKFKKIIDNLENIIKADIPNIENLYLSYCSNFTKKEKKFIENTFNYSYNRNSNKKFMEHFKKLNIKSCPFCNNNHVYFYTQGIGKVNTLATLEHYYPKAEYPHLSLSFYNLIPSCSTCNSKFKGTKQHVGNILHPYYDSFHERAEFKVKIGKRLIKKSVDLEIDLKINDTNDSKCKTSIDRFQLDKIYSQHNDIAKEIWNKAQVYNQSRIDELYKEFFQKLGYSKEDVKNMIFCNYLHKDDINKRNHSKLTQDIVKQFRI